MAAEDPSDASGAWCSGESLWNTSSMWYSSHPHMHQCSRYLLLQILPCIFLFLFSPSEFLSSSRRHQRVPWRILNIIRIILALIIFAFHVIEYAEIVKETGDNVPGIVMISSIVQSLSFLWTALLLIHAKVKGFVRSGVVWIFVTLSLIGAAFDYYFILDDGETVKEVSEIAGSHVILYATVLLFILCSIADRAVVLDKKSSEGSSGVPSSSSSSHVEQQNLSPKEVASFPSYMTMSWVTSLARRGFRDRVIDLEDLHPVVHHNRSSVLGSLLRKNLVKRTDYHDEDYQGISGTIFRTFHKEFLFTGFMRILCDLSELAKPLLVKCIILFLMDQNDFSWHGYFLSASLLLASICHNIFNTVYNDRAQSLGVRIRTSLQSCLYRKSLTMSCNTSHSNERMRSSPNQTTKEMMILSSETEKIRLFVERMHSIWSLLIQVILCIALLYSELGPSSLMTIIPMFIIIAVDFLISQRVEHLSEQQSMERDERIRNTSELLQEIRSIKLNSWEESFESLIKQIRTRQVKLIRKIRYYTSVNLITWSIGPMMFCLFTYLMYVNEDSYFMHPGRLFFSLIIFFIMRNACKGWPDVYNLYSDSKSAIIRLNTFFSTPDLRKYICRDRDDKNHTITMEDAVFAWNSNHLNSDPSFRLKAEGLRIPEGSLAVIVGASKAGKSSLISAILGEMELLDGRVNISPDIQKTAFVPQSPWIMNGTVKENILFGKLYESVKYLKIVTSCDLEDDFAHLPDGDMTLIGEHGHALTESMRSRISLARACYSDADLILLDDPLTILEHDVRKIIHHKVLSSRTGILKKKTRVLVTRSMDLAQEADRIFVMREGRITEWGTFTELSATPNSVFASIMKSSGSSMTPDVVPTEDSELANDHSIKLRKDWVRIGKRVTRKQFVMTQRSCSMRESAGPRSSMAVFMSEQNHKKVIDRRDTSEDEESESKAPSSMRMLGFFMKRMSSMLILLIPGYILFQILVTSSLICLTNWSSDEVWVHNHTFSQDGQDVDPLKENRGLVTFTVFSIASILALLIAVFALARGSTRACIKLHDRLLHAIVRAPMTFFDMTSVIQIMDRFVIDLAPIDSCFFEELNLFFLILLEMIACFIVTIVIMPYFAIVVVILLIFFMICKSCYTGTAVQIQKMDESTSSVILSSFSQTLSGAASIRAFGMTKRFIRDSDQRIDRHQACTSSLSDLNQWRGFRMELLGNIALFSASIIAITSKGTIDPSFLGLGITLAYLMGRQFTSLMRASCFLHHESKAVHSIHEFTIKCEQELDWHVAIPPPDFWPPHGAVRYYDISARYRPGLDLAIKNANFLILPQEKIGVVGRDGSGKSTIALTMMRMIEVASGTIVIDGIDVSTIGVMDLRSRISIMTQDPVILSGSIRRNLDPFYECTDEELWWSLEVAHMKDYVWNLSHQLQQDVMTINLNVGQKQLISLARALLFKKRILILDEATGMLDPETEDIIFSVIKDQFADCTIINMTNHLNTIMDSDRVLVMEDGKVAEFDPPKVLVNDPDSLFFAMAKDAGVI